MSSAPPYRPTGYSFSLAALATGSAISLRLCTMRPGQMAGTQRSWCVKNSQQAKTVVSGRVYRTVDTNPLRSEVHGHLPGHANDARLDRLIPYRIPSGEHAVDAGTTKVSSVTEDIVIVLRLPRNSPSANVAPGHVYDGASTGGCHVWDGALAGAEDRGDGDGELVLPRAARRVRGGQRQQQCSGQSTVSWAVGMAASGQGASEQKRARAGGSATPRAS